MVDFLPTFRSWLCNKKVIGLRGAVTVLDVETDVRYHGAVGPTATRTSGGNCGPRT